MKKKKQKKNGSADITELKLIQFKIHKYMEAL